MIFKTINQARKTIKQLQQSGSSVALVTGCFDIIHFGHIDLFNFCRQKADKLVVCLENDYNIKHNKGQHRPIFNSQKRLQVLAAINAIDHLLVNPDKVTWNSTEADQWLSHLLRRLQPTFLITNPYSDKNWQKKQQTCQPLNIKLIPFKQKNIFSSTQALKQLTHS